MVRPNGSSKPATGISGGAANTSGRAGPCSWTGSNDLSLNAETSTHNAHRRLAVPVLFDEQMTLGLANKGWLRWLSMNGAFLPTLSRASQRATTTHTRRSICYVRFVINAVSCGVDVDDLHINEGHDLQPVRRHIHQDEASRVSEMGSPLDFLRFNDARPGFPIDYRTIRRLLSVPCLTRIDVPQG
jgi:hypothetical protein